MEDKEAVLKQLTERAERLSQEVPKFSEVRDDLRKFRAMVAGLS